MSLETSDRASSSGQNSTSVSSSMGTRRERQLVVAPKLSLVNAVYAFLLLFTFSFLSILAYSVSSRSDLVFEGALVEAASVRTQVAAEQMSKELGTKWRHLGVLADQLSSGASTEVVSGIMSAFAQGSSGETWAALVSSTGAVVLSTDDTVAGSQLSDATWLQDGLIRGTAMVDENFGPIGGPALIMMRPVQLGDRPVGAIVFAQPIASVGNALQSNANVLGADLMVMDATDRVVVSTIDGVSSDVKLVLSGSANLNGASSQKQVWPDGKTYYVSEGIEIEADGVQKLGWRMVGRLESTSFSVAFTEIIRFGLFVGASLSVVLAVAVVIFVNIFIKPISRLSLASVEIANGGAGYPPEIRTSAESARLSAALAKLQTYRLSSKV